MSSNDPMKLFSKVSNPLRSLPPGKLLLCVLDFEATCDDVNPPSPQEIIEFPSILLHKIETGCFVVKDEFGSEYGPTGPENMFVRPKFHPKLTDFCKGLTSITQEQVDSALEFPMVYERHQQWLEKNGAFDPKNTFYFVTCGDWDLRKMLPNQLKAYDLDKNFTHFAYSRWINLKKVFAETTGNKTARCLADMLKFLELPFDGTPHRGIDDCRNIVKIVQKLNDNYGAEFSRPTASLN